MAYEEYWIKRADARMAQVQSGSDQTIMAVSEAYEDAMKQLNKDIDRLFFRFAGKNGLSKEEAEKLLNETLSSQEVEKIRSRIDTIQDENIRQQLYARLDATVTKARITRLEALKEDIYIQASRMADVELQHSTARYIDIIQEEYLHNIFDCQQYLGLAYSFSRIPEKTVKEILKEDWSGKHYSKRIWENAMVGGEKIEEVVEKLLLKGTLTGINSRKMAKELSEITNVETYACERLIRTETTYFTAMADIEAAKGRGTKRMQFVATLDDRTSEQCRKHDGQIINIEDIVPGRTAPPLHPFCRSVLIDVIEGLTHKVRTARNPKTGKNYKVPADMDYKEWKKKYVDSSVLCAPDIDHPMMQQAEEKFDELLNKNDDGSNLFEMMRMCKDNAAYVEDTKLDNAFAYFSDSDEIRYNPQHKSFADYDMNFVLSHELGHRLDITWCHSWENKEFLVAIDVTRDKLYNEAYIWQTAILEGGVLHEDLAFNDIISALTNNTMISYGGHSYEYWTQSPQNVPMEIFANLAAIKITKCKSYSAAGELLKELFDAMERMI